MTFDPIEPPLMLINDAVKECILSRDPSFAELSLSWTTMAKWEILSVLHVCKHSVYNICGLQ